ncbi:valine--tRNA ligase [Lutimonas saemankumensis]|uniref:valine--tRNA ligase n=1 Tax=Lutimonas saemankumensis TaxID=483016 RepID=UPI001CD7DC7C|nr:valine--tRNA ligase [Lutimonas saemankumensis]MCA0932264.1 valine--tRNA ligase [Lutimonas saemankumensis]
MNIPAKYNAQLVEEKWYRFWMENNYFHSEPDDREPYTIVIPPPNVTGVLHMGHMLNNTIQDVLIRRKRMLGYNACWVPGTDHASIATEAKVVAKLKAQGIEKSELSREEFIEHAWDWTREHGGLILEQLKKLGASCDWERTKFTMDEDLNKAVNKVFVNLHEKGLIYKGYRMVNWDPEAKTTLSDEEVIYVEQPGKLYYVNYNIEGSEEVVQIATTRPETILGDTAICVHPEDERFFHLKGKKAIVPIVNRSIPIIEDEYVDREFGTGSLKITPAHDPNDKEIGEKHNLEVIDIFNDDATLNRQGLHYEGMDRFKVRKEIVKELEEKGFLVKTEDYMHKVGTSERTKAVIEPKISEQWFLKMEDLVKPAIEAVLKKEEVKLVPHKFVNTYRHWMENIRDWNISRQLYWGHRIPAYYYSEGTSDYVVAENAEEALSIAKEKTGNKNLKAGDIRQDEDSLDTWFSSWLWPISVFDGINNPENKDFKYYYPTNDLVTGPDILFFWVARMIIAGYEFADEKPFEHVYLTGLVRDKKRRKMSKSLGNSPDPVELMESYGADGVRAGILMSSAAGNDLLFDEGLMLQGRNFANKIWNGFRLVKGWKVNSDSDQPDSSRMAIEWYQAKFNKTLKFVNEQFDQYRLSDALTAIYKLVWDDFSSWYLEMVKPQYGESMDSATFEATVAFFEDNIKILHPFMPFISEEIWQYFKERNTDEALIVSKYPEQGDFNESILESFEVIKEIISAVRNLRKQKNISFKEKLDLFVLKKESIETGFYALIGKMCNISKLIEIDEKIENALTFRVGSNEFFIPFKEEINIEEERSKLEEELAYHKGFLASVQKKLANERFVSNAPEKVIEMERKKEADALAKINMLEQSLAALKS